MEDAQRQQTHNNVGEKEQRREADSAELIALEARGAAADAGECQGGQRHGADDDLEEDEEERVGGGLGVCNDKLLQESLNEKEGREIGRGVGPDARCFVAECGGAAPLRTILHRRKAQKKGQGVACVWRDGCSAQLRVAVNTFLCQMQKMAGWRWGRSS